MASPRFAVVPQRFLEEGDKTRQLWWHAQEVSYASIDGGLFPATSDSRFTSVGMSAIERFLRPVCHQGFPDELLPEALRHLASDRRGDV